MFIGNPEEKTERDSQRVPITAQLTVSKGLKKAGGLSLIAFGGLVLLSLPLTFAAMSVLAPASPQAGIQALPGLSSTLTAFRVNFTVADLFGMVAIASLSIVLVGASQFGSLAAALLGVLGFVIDLATDISLRFSQITIAAQYAGATSDAQRNGLLAAYQFESDYASVTLLVGVVFMVSLALIILGYVIRRSNGLFSTRIAYFAILGGVSGVLIVPLFGTPAFAAVFFINAILVAAFSIMAGRRMLRT